MSCLPDADPFRRWSKLAKLFITCALVGVFFTSCRTAPTKTKPVEDPADSRAEHRMKLSPPTRPPPPAEHRFREVAVEEPYVALTFDDGPNAALTPELLDILKERGIRATFFVVGQRVAAHPEILRRIAREGHEIGNHTWDHPDLHAMTLQGAREQLERTSQVIRAACGRSPDLMRPPYGRTSPELEQWIFDEFDLKVILWSIDSGDWRHKDADRVQETIVAEARPGAIILCHDIQPSAIVAMPATLDLLQARGFKFATVSELIALGGGQVKEPGPGGGE